MVFQSDAFMVWAWYHNCYGLHLRAVASWETMKKRTRFTVRYLIVAFAVMLVVAQARPLAEAYAGDAGQLPVTQGSVTRNDARITFEWPEAVPFKVKAKGTVVTIIFPRKADPNFGPMLSSLYPYVTSAQRKSDGKTIVLTLDKPYKIRTFQADAISGIDLLHIDPERRPGMQLAMAAAALNPAAGGNAVALSTPNDSAPKPGHDKQVDVNAAVEVNISASADSAVLRFPFQERVSLAAFVRNNVLWVVLGEKIALDLHEFDDINKTVLSKGQIFPGSMTILRIPVADGISASVSKQENSFEWAVLLSNVKKPPSQPLKVDINTDPPAPPHVFINALQMANAITMTDPVIGDDLIVIPMYSLGEGMAYRREFVDFNLLETAEGVVIAKKSDDVAVTALRNGLRITLPQGATLTPGLPNVEKTATPEALQSVPTLFPNDKWVLPAGLPERAVMRDLMSQVVASDNVQDANDHRLRLAQLYLSDGMGAEALAMLDGIKRTDINFYRSAKLTALRGAANFLMQRYTDAAQDFSASELNNNKETDFWRNMLADLQGKEGNYDYLELNTDYISRYPPSFRQKVAIIAADRSVDSKEYNTAIKILETLGVGTSSPVVTAAKPKEKEGEGAKKHAEAKKEPGKKETGKKEEATNDTTDLVAPINNYVRFLLAKIAADTGQADQSMQELTELSEDYSHPYVRSRAEYSRIILEMNRDIIKKDQVVERLERLRLAWHGDSLELKVLGFLGEIYADNKDYVNAMRIWDNAVHAYAGTPQAAEITHKMEDTFVKMFNEGTIDTLSPLDALALYYQYKNYAPPGSIGREMTANLADRLVTMDLLEQAAGLLEHQMRNDSEKSQRSQLGAKVATIYLLNHEPKKALRALQDSVYGENSGALHQLRNRLAAESLVELNDSDRAYQILAQDSSVDAERIRLNILWQKRDWPHIVHTVENILKARKDIAAPITVEESEHVIQLGLAYIFENNKEQLQYLHDYFTPLMKDNPNKPLFDFITATDVTPTPTNFDDVVKNLITTRSFIDSYRAQIKTAGLSSVVPKNNPTP